MNGLMHFLENTLAPLGTRIGNQRHLKAVRDGFMMAMPLVLVGSFFLLLISWPDEAFNYSVQGLLQDIGIYDILTTMNQSTMAIISLVAVFGIAYRLSESYETDGPSAGVLALSSFILMAPRFATQVFNEEGEQVTQLFGGAIPFSSLNANALFVAIVVGLVTAEIYRFFIQRGIVIKMPKNVPDVVSRSFSALLPTLTTLIFWACLLKGLDALGVEGGLGAVLGLVIGQPLRLIAGTMFGMVIVVLVNSLFWFCGVNGGQVLNAFVDPVWLQMTEENQLAAASGEVLPNIITLPFKDLFVFIGGGGATIGLGICLFLFSRSKTYKTLGRISFIPSFFNINTAILFSFPTVLNPIMMIPFVLAPTINALITYLAMYTGLVPLTTGVVLPWTMPPIIGGFLATGGSWQGAVLQVVLIAISFAIYYPFFRVADKNNLEKEKEE
ncbi:PTS cellobiose transporter subunit IIC [Streptococcus gallolyticus]|uniref:Permease IIC component n=1 Tax=Streptococcus gallolyticus TaxID=315405 RepID=A0A368UC21_9STRE|nr:PTS sugar transporter subunit IIC [Streptococcus gallolyticus]RCW16518.1 PTS cellobiose transporter subunit IIC [Streptococcus gallolyticus]